MGRLVRYHKTVDISFTDRTTFSSDGLKGMMLFCNYRNQKYNEKGQKLYTTHIWQEYLDLVEQIRKTEGAKKI